MRWSVLVAVGGKVDAQAVGVRDLLVDALEVRPLRQQFQATRAIGVHGQQYAASREVATDVRQAPTTAAQLEVEVPLRGMTDVDRGVANLAPGSVLVVDVGEHQQATDVGSVLQVDLQQLLGSTLPSAGAVVVVQLDVRGADQAAEIGVRLERLHSTSAAIEQLVQADHVDVIVRVPRGAHIECAPSLAE